MEAVVEYIPDELRLPARAKPAERYPLFEYLRLFLAIEVAYLLHAYGMASKGGQTFIALPAVPVFLSISGFLVLQSLDRSKSVGGFWVKRALRIFPAFLLSFALVFALHGPGGVSSAIHAYLGLQVPDSATGNNPLWSLSCEEIVYLGMCALSIVGIYRERFAVYVLLGGALLFEMYCYTTGNGERDHADLLVAFFTGNVLYLHKDQLRNLRATAILLMVFSFAIGFVLYRAPVPWLVLFWILLSSVGAILMCVNFVEVPRMPFDLSYGIYIFHFPVLAYLNTELRLPPEKFWPLAVVIPVAIAFVSWFFVESPVLGLKKRFSF